MSEKMKVKYVVLRDNGREIDRFDTEEAAEKKIAKMGEAGFLGDVELYIRKVFTTRKK